MVLIQNPGLSSPFLFSSPFYCYPLQSKHVCFKKECFLHANPLALIVSHCTRRYVEGKVQEKEKAFGRLREERRRAREKERKNTTISLRSKERSREPLKNSVFLSASKRFPPTCGGWRAQKARFESPSLRKEQGIKRRKAE